MRKTFIWMIVLLSLVLVACDTSARGAAAVAPNAPLPSTVDEAVVRLLGDLHAADIDWIRRNPKDSVTGQLYMGYGTGMRNEFGLWGGNDALRKSCGTEDPEGCSVVIIEAMWDRVQAQTSPALRSSLQCQFATIHKIRINTTGWYLLTVGEMLDAMQTQIDRQVKTAAAPGCPAQVRIVPLGDLNRQCFVRAEFEDEQPLDVALMWLGFRNEFAFRHAPPGLELKFNNACAWPERPTDFAPKSKQSNP